MSTAVTKRLSIFKAQTNAAFRLLKQMGVEQREEAYSHWQKISQEIQNEMERSRKESTKTIQEKETEKDNSLTELDNQSIRKKSKNAETNKTKQEIVQQSVALASDKSPKTRKVNNEKSPVTSQSKANPEPRRSARKSKPNKLFEDSIVDLKSLSKALGEDHLSEEEDTKPSNSQSNDNSYVIIKKNVKQTSEIKAPIPLVLNEINELSNTDENEVLIKDTTESGDSEQLEGKGSQHEVKSVYKPRRKHLTKEELKTACKCKVCGKKLANRSNLSVHMRTHNGDKPYCCKECKRSFSTKPNLLRHIRTHTGEKPYECPECKKRFIEKKAMDVHMRSHTGEKPYECELCKRQFSQPGTLQSHMHVHTGWKGYSCEKCEKSFRQRSQLKIHLLRHENIKNHSCSHDGCDKAFVSKAELIRHMIRHTGERAFLCKDCPKSFTRLQYLKEHANTHAGRKAFKCHICSEAFTMSASYSKHMKKHDQMSESNSVESAEENSQPTMVYVIQANADSERSEKTMVVPQELLAQKSTETNSDIQAAKTGPTPIAKVSDLQQAGLQIIQHVDANGQVQYTIVDPNSGDATDNEEYYQMDLSNILNHAQVQSQTATDAHSQTILIQGDSGESLIGVRGSDGTVYITGNQPEDDALLEMAPIPDHEALTGNQDQVQNRAILEEDEDNSERIPQTVHEVSGMMTNTEDPKEDSLHQGTVVTQTYVNEDYSDLSAIKMLVSSTEQQ